MTEQQQKTVELARLEVVVTMTEEHVETDATVWLHPDLREEARQNVLETLAGASGEVLTSSYEKLTGDENEEEN